MRVTNIYYSNDFIRQVTRLPVNIRKKAIIQERLFRQNPFHPSLRVHNLKGKMQGLWSISVNRAYRILFKISENGEIIFISIGTHAVYS